VAHLRLILPGNRGEKKRKQHPAMTKRERRQQAKKAKRQKQKVAKASAPKPALKAGSPETPAKPVKDQNGKVVFSKFDFSQANGVTTSAADGKKKVDPKATLNKLRKQKETAQKLEAKGEMAKLRTMEDDQAWSKAAERAKVCGPSSLGTCLKR